MSKRNEFVALLNVLFCVWVMMTVAVPAFAQNFPHAAITAIKVPDTVIVNQPIFIDVTVNNDGGDAKAGGISISLPDNPLVSIIYADTTRATVYPVGSQIWSNTEKKAIPSKHILVEAWQEPWKANEEHHFRLKVMPVKTGTLRLFVRATVTVPKVKRQIIATPDSGPLDQQGFPVKEYTVTVTEPLTRGAPQSPNASTGLTVTINQIDAAYYPEVICYVVVTDASDRPIGSLTKANFTVLENEAEQPITSVTPLAIGGGNTVPIDVVLTIDRSGSMQDEGKMPAAITAARTFVDLMQPSDQAKIISFASKIAAGNIDVQDHGDFTNAKSNLSSIIAMLNPGGQTALYDAVATS
ncbi:VWA domain-containing protein, partial [Candidatus Poribacteria bacterium]|nr:VWA domain-containing protein [Candidatus Poribacteria bacterium]